MRYRRIQIASVVRCGCVPSRRRWTP